jgi:kynurenine formamidase
MGGLPGTVVDLTLPISEAHPSHWPTHVPFQHKSSNWFETRAADAQPVLDQLGPYATKWMLIDEHTGTHMDAPSHFIPPPDSGLPFANEWGDVHADGVPLEQLIGPAAVIDAPDRTSAPGESPYITPDDVTAWEAEHGRLAAGDIVLLRSGWDEHYLPGSAGSAYAFDVVVRQSRPGWPAPAVATVELLVERGVRCIGTDGPTMGAAQGGQDIHVAALGRGAVFIEALGNLSSLPHRGAVFIFMPIKTLHATGAPGRAVGLV